MPEAQNCSSFLIPFPRGKIPKSFGLQQVLQVMLKSYSLLKEFVFCKLWCTFHLNTAIAV